MFEKCSPQQNKVLFDKMLSKRIEVDTIAINYLIKNSEDFNEAIFYYKKLSDYNLPHTNTTYNNLSTKVKTLEEHEFVIEKATKKSFFINKRYYDNAIQMSKDFEQAFHFYKVFVKMSKIPPDSHTFNKLIKQADTYSRVLMVLRLMNENNVQPDNYTYGSIRKVIRSLDADFKDDFYKIFGHYPSLY